MINYLYDLTLIYAACYVLASFLRHLHSLTRRRQAEQNAQEVYDYTATLTDKDIEMLIPLKDYLSLYTIRELKKLASEKHIKNYGSMTKQQLINVLGV